MPTARPIIIEKFIDHTDSGVARPRRCRAAKPTAMPAMARTRGMPAATAEPKATSSRTMVGRPDSSSALWRASSLEVLKSLQTGHSPVTSSWAPAGGSRSPTKDMTCAADSGRSASSVASSGTGINTVRPSGATRPASAGMASGSTTPVLPGAPCERGHDLRHTGRVGGDGRVLSVDDVGRLGAELGEVAPQLVAHRDRRGAARLPAGAGEGAGEGEGEGRGHEHDGEPQPHDPAPSGDDGAGQSGEQRLATRAPRGNRERDRVACPAGSWRPLVSRLVSVRTA